MLGIDFFFYQDLSSHTEPNILIQSLNQCPSSIHYMLESSLYAGPMVEIRRNGIPKQDRNQTNAMK